MIINLNEIITILKKIEIYLSKQNNTNLEIDNDLYLLIGSDEWYDLLNDHKPDVGSLVDDIESLRKNVVEMDFVTPVDLDRLSSILRAISEKISPLHVSQ